MLTAAERQYKITELLHHRNKVSIEEISLLFEVSKVTVRKDLNHLHRENLLIRTHGYAISNKALSITPLLTERNADENSLKVAIANTAAHEINNGDSIFLASGAITLEIARNLSNKENLTIMTNCLKIATGLARYESFDVMCTGGSISKQSLSFHSRAAEESLNNFRFHKLFIEIGHFGIDKGITTNSEAEACIKRKICECSSQIIAVADSSKLYEYGVHLIKQSKEIDVLFTDKNIPERYISALVDHGVALYIIEI